MKIKDVKAIEKLLPKRDKKRRVDSGYELIRQGKNSMISYVRNTELPPCNKYVEVNLKLTALYLYENQPECLTAISKERRGEACYNIAKAIHEAKLCEYKKGE